jgi:hypothetical protein
MMLQLYRAARRRFDPDRPLHTFPRNFAQLRGRLENSSDRERASSPIHHLKLAGNLFPKEPREARSAPRFNLGDLSEALVLEALYPRVRRRADPTRRRICAAIIYPDRFVEPQKADAGASAGNLEGGEITSGNGYPAARTKPQ